MFLLPSYLEKREMYVPRKTLGREIIFRKEGLVLGREVDWSEGGPEGGLASKGCSHLESGCRRRAVHGSRGTAAASSNISYFSWTSQAAHYQDMTSILQRSLLAPGTSPVQTLAG